jgi:hypothetical protein
MGVNVFGSGVTPALHQHMRAAALDGCRSEPLERVMKKVAGKGADTASTSHPPYPARSLYPHSQKQDFRMRWPDPLPTGGAQIEPSEFDAGEGTWTAFFCV